MSEREFLTLYGNGWIVKVEPNLPKLPDDDPDQPDALMRSIRLFWTRTFDADPVKRSALKLEPFIERHRHLQPRAPDEWVPKPYTLMKWLRERGSPDDRRPRHMGDRHRKGPSSSRLQPEVLAVLQELQAHFWNKGSRLGYKDVYVLLRAKLFELNKERLKEGLDRLTVPSRSTVWRRTKGEITPERARSRYGPRVAYRAFKAVQGTWEAKRILDLVLGDAQRLDCFVVDNQRRVVIGRPWWTVLIDVRSRSLLGCHISFDDPSVGTIMAALRMAVKPKLDLQTRYPDLEGEWEAFGVPRCIRLDNAWENTGSSFADACEDAGISIEWAPVRTPEAKGIVERVFRTFNDRIIHKLPGAVPFKPELLHEYGIDPQKSAVLTLAELERFIYLCNIEVYNYDRHDTLGTAPLKVWRERSEIDHIDIASDLSTLEMALAKHVKNCTLTREGVRFKNLRYCSHVVSDLLADLVPLQPPRSARFGTVKVKIKYHPEDMSRIFVWNERLGEYVAVPCIEVNYTQGLSERLHDLLEAQDRKEDMSFCSEDERCIRKARLLLAMDKSLAAASIQDRRKDYRVLVGSSSQAALETASSPTTVLITGVANRRGGDQPTKSARRGAAGRKRQSLAVTPTTSEVSNRPVVQIDPFARFDRSGVLNRALGGGEDR